MGTAKEYFERAKNMSDHELDADMFKNSPYAGMSFERLDDWNDNFYAAEWNNYQYSSPRFKFENGDIIAVNKEGELIKINE